MHKSVLGLFILILISVVSTTSFAATKDPQKQLCLKLIQLGKPKAAPEVLDGIRRESMEPLLTHAEDLVFADPITKSLKPFQDEVGINEATSSVILVAKPLEYPVGGFTVSHDNKMAVFIPATVTSPKIKGPIIADLQKDGSAVNPRGFLKLNPKESLKAPQFILQKKILRMGFFSLEKRDQVEMRFFDLENGSVELPSLSTVLKMSIKELTPLSDTIYFVANESKEMIVNYDPTYPESFKIIYEGGPSLLTHGQARDVVGYLNKSTGNYSRRKDVLKKASVVFVKNDRAITLTAEMKRQIPPRKSFTEFKIINSLGNELQRWQVDGNHMNAVATKFAGGYVLESKFGSSVLSSYILLKNDGGVQPIVADIPQFAKYQVTDDALIGLSPVRANRSVDLTILPLAGATGAGNQIDPLRFVRTSFELEQYLLTKDAYRKVLENVDRAVDAVHKLKAINEYLNGQTEITDKEFIGLIKLMPRGENESSLDLGEVQRLMKELKIKDWTPFPVSMPLRVRILWTALSKIRLVTDPAKLESTKPTALKLLKLMSPKNQELNNDLETLIQILYANAMVYRVK